MPLSLRVRLGVFGALIVFFAALPAADAAVSVVKPNGGECLTVGQAYTIEITSSADHVALYYRADGTQPTHLQDPVIRHPLNQTTDSWTPSSGNVSETGRIWVEGHINNHNTNGEWDNSNADFAIRTSCAAAASSGSGSGSFSAIPPTLTPPAALSPTSIRWNFRTPEYPAGEVRLIVKENFLFVEKLRAAVSVPASADGYIIEAGLQPNTRYGDRYLQIAQEGALANVSNLSNPHYPIYTRIEEPAKLTAVSASPTSITVAVASPLSNLGAGLSGVFFENLTAGKVSGWQKASRWMFEGLEPDTTYQFQAKTRNAEGIEERPSEVFAVLTLSQGASTPAPGSAASTPSLSVGVTNGRNAGALIRLLDDIRVFVVANGFKRHLPTPDIFAGYGFKWEAVRQASPEEFTGISETSLVRLEGQPDVWFLTGRVRRHIPNPEVFNLHGFLWNAVADVNEQELAWYTPTRLLREAGDVRVWYAENGERRWVSSPAVFVRHSFRWEEVVEVPRFELEGYREAASIE